MLCNLACILRSFLMYGDVIIWCLTVFGSRLGRSFVAVGVDPAIMGVGPAAAIPVAVKASGLELDDIDLFEINEVFIKLWLNIYFCFHAMRV